MSADTTLIPTALKSPGCSMAVPDSTTLGLLSAHFPSITPKAPRDHSPPLQCHHGPARARTRQTPPPLPGPRQQGRALPRLPAAATRLHLQRASAAAGRQCVLLPALLGGGLQAHQHRAPGGRRGAGQSRLPVGPHAARPGAAGPAGRPALPAHRGLPQPVRRAAALHQDSGRAAWHRRRPHATLRDAGRHLARSAQDVPQCLSEGFAGAGDRAGGRLALSIA